MALERDLSGEPMMVVVMVQETQQGRPKVHDQAFLNGPGGSRE